MAELLNRIPTNLTEYPNSFKRQGAFPLEAYSVFYTMADAEAYASTNAVSYVGQTIAVVTANAEDASVVDSVTLYIIADAAGHLQEVGRATSGDGNSIVLDENGVLSLAGFAAAAEATLPQKQTDGTIKWVPIDSIVEGDTNTKTVVAAGEDETRVIIEKVRDEDFDTNTYKISLDLDDYYTADEVDDAIAEAIGTAATEDDEATGIYAAIAEAEARAKAYADANDSDTIYDDKALVARVKALEDEERYDETALANRVTDLEDVVGDADDGLVKDVADNAKAISDMDAAYKAADTEAINTAKAYTDDEIAGLEVVIEQKDGVEYIVVKNKAGDEVASANASKFVQDSFLDDVSYDAETGKVSFTWTMGDGSTKTDEIDIAHLVDTYTAGNGLKVENNEFAIDTEVVATVDALDDVREIAEAAQTAKQVSDAIDAKIAAENLSQYAKADDVEEALEGKVDSTTYEADKATFALAADVEDTLEGYYTKDDIDGKAFAVATDVADTYATKKALSDHAAAAEAAYAKATEVEAELAKKIETGSIAHASDEKAEGVTVDGTKLDIVVDAFTKAETRQYVADTIKTMTGGESAADVKLLLENHIDAYEEKVGQLDAKDAAQDTAIATAKTQADKGVEEAGKANAAIEALKTGEIKTNADNITALDGRVDVLEEAKGDHETRISTAEGKIVALEGADKAINTEIGTINVALGTLANKDAELAGLIRGNTDKFAEYYTSSQVDTKLQEVAASIPDLAPYAKTADVNASIAAINTAMADKANAADVYTKEEAELAFMNQDEVDARINALIAAADPEDGKVITDIQNLVKYVDENAGEIAALLTTVGGHTTDIQKNAEDIADINDSIAALIQPKASAEISVANDGTLGIKEMNVNKLVQTEGDTLILNGGKSGVTTQA